MKIQTIKLKDSRVKNILRVIAEKVISQKGFYTCTIAGVKTRIVK